MRAIVFIRFVIFLLCSAPGSVVLGEVVLGPRPGEAIEVSRGDLLLAELNCVACHRATESQRMHLGSRTAPVLGSNGMAMTPQFLRRYISDPGEYKDGTVMPNLLHGLPQAERAEAVEALVHYLLSEQGRTPGQGIAGEAYMVRQGRVLYHTIGCVACHEPHVPPDAVPGLTTTDPEREVFAADLKTPNSVPLGDLARKTTVEELARFLMEPLKVRPAGRMPAHNLTTGEATNIAVYLLRAQIPGLNDPNKRSAVAGLKYHYYEESFGPDPDFEKLTPKASGTMPTFSIEPKKREQYFGFRFSGSIRIPREGRYTFYVSSDDGGRLYIDGKLVVDNWGDHAPEEKDGTVELTEGEHSIAVSYYNNGAGYEFYVFWKGPEFEKQEIPPAVLSHVTEPMTPLDNEELMVDARKAARGPELFESVGCASCHEISGQPARALPGAKALSELRAFEGGCLAEAPPAAAARYGLSAEQRKQLRAALERRSFDRRIADGERIVFTMAQLNCFACHTRDATGGATNERLAYFRMNGDLDLGDEGRIPPHLTEVGGKLKRGWLRDVLMNAGRVRPYMATRMPQFGERNVGHLPELFERVDAREERPAPEYTQREAKFGRVLAGSEGLSCISCHNFGGHKSLGIPALDMATMAPRLRYDWFRRYLMDPQSLRPGTRMPTFWPGGESVNTEILSGNTEAQIAALWAYLNSNPETDLPSGLIRGRKEIVAEGEPVIYRNFIEGAGTRAIGVGYPEKVNLAFDGNNMRLAMIWHGPFIDGARHSSGRGEGFEPPLGHNILRMSEGAPFALLEDASAPWPEGSGREAGYRMAGYTLDEKGRPTFAYEFSGLRIEERFEPMEGEIDGYFRRVFRIVGSPVENLWFRAARGDLVEEGGVFVLNGKVQMKFDGAEAVLRESRGAKELLAPVRLENGATRMIQEIIW